MNPKSKNSLLLSLLAANLPFRRRVSRDCFHHQVVRANRRDFLVGQAGPLSQRGDRLARSCPMEAVGLFWPKIADFAEGESAAFNLGSWVPRKRVANRLSRVWLNLLSIGRPSLFRRG
jgi:hypothetical protein